MRGDILFAAFSGAVCVSRLLSWRATSNGVVVGYFSVEGALLPVLFMLSVLL